MELEKYESEDEEFDMNWMDEIEEESKMYNHFFITNNTIIQVYIYYINRNNELFDGKKVEIKLTNNILHKNDIIEIIRKNMFVDKKKYRLMSMLSYNFDLNNDEIKKYHKNTNSFELLNIHKNISAINYKETINFFKELNDLYLFFVETKSTTNQNKTKRIILKKKRKKKTRRKKIKTYIK
tara:strand:- start:382 stop:924 length:543 start_codon:yes stop_codon:yes gene_type:complete